MQKMFSIVSTGSRTENALKHGKKVHLLKEDATKTTSELKELVVNVFACLNNMEKEISFIWASKSNDDFCCMTLPIPNVIQLKIMEREL